jgi:hypothetical protein
MAFFRRSGAVKAEVMEVAMPWRMVVVVCSPSYQTRIVAAEKRARGGE